MEDPNLKGWHTRGYLPHFDSGEVAQFVTFRLAGSLPNKIIKGWKEELKREARTGDVDIELELYRKIERFLDQNQGKCHLKDARIALMVEKALLHFNGGKYRLYSWVIMPNHVHLLLMPLTANSLTGVMHSIKSFTAGEANRILARKGGFWQRDYFDRYIRSEEHFFHVVRYIENNPVKARLCRKPADWKFSSAARRLK